MYYPSCAKVTYGWNGYQYDPCSTCLVHDTLTRPSGPTSNYLLTSKDGGSVAFDAYGFGTTHKDRNGNTLELDYNPTGQTSGGSGDRGEDFTFTHHTSGFMSSFVDSCERTWSFGYDSAGNMTSFHTPESAQQPSGVTVAFSYDSSGRLIGIDDGRGNDIVSVTYVGTTGQVDTLTLDGEDFSMAYFSEISSTIFPGPRPCFSSISMRAWPWKSGSYMEAGNMLTKSFASLGRSLAEARAVWRQWRSSSKTRLAWAAASNMLRGAC